MSDLEPQLRLGPAIRPAAHDDQLVPPGREGQPSEFAGGWTLSAGDRITPHVREDRSGFARLALVGAVAAIGAVAGYAMTFTGRPVPPPAAAVSDVVPAAAPDRVPLVETGAVETGALPNSPPQRAEVQPAEPLVTASVAPEPVSEPPGVAIGDVQPPVAPSIVNASPPPAPVAAAPPPPPPPPAAPVVTAPVVQPKVLPSTPPQASAPSRPNAPHHAGTVAPQAKKPAPAEGQKVARADLPAPSGLRTSQLPPATAAPRSSQLPPAAPSPQVYDRQAPPPLRPASADSRDPLQMRAAQVGLHPRLPSELLARLSAEDYHNAGVAIRTAVAETAEGATFVWPRQPWQDLATFRVRVVRAANPDCHRYVVTVVKDGWSTTAPPMETCEVPVNRRY